MLRRSEHLKVLRRSIDQCSPTGGMRTTGDTRRIVWWYARILDYHLFHNSIKRVKFIINIVLNVFKLKEKCS
jgi:hypothetical protein